MANFVLVFLSALLTGACFYAMLVALRIQAVIEVLARHHVVQVVDADHVLLFGRIQLIENYLLPFVLLFLAIALLRRGISATPSPRRSSSSSSSSSSSLSNATESQEVGVVVVAVVVVWCGVVCIYECVCVCVCVCVRTCVG
jgi:hypothetical protein